MGPSWHDLLAINVKAICSVMPTWFNVTACCCLHWRQQKKFLALAQLHTMIGDTYFNGKAWANFSASWYCTRLNQYKWSDLPLRTKHNTDKTELEWSAALAKPPIDLVLVIGASQWLFGIWWHRSKIVWEKQGKTPIRFGLSWPSNLNTKNITRNL